MTIDTSAEAVERLARWHAKKADESPPYREAHVMAVRTAATLRALAAERDRLAAENAKMRNLLKRTDEELRLIRMKATGALYDIELRAALSAALAGDSHD